jgi:MFS family permease
MSAAINAQPGIPTIGDAIDKDDPSIRSRTGMARLGIALALGGMAWTIPFGASIVVLLPAKVATIDAAHKVPLLAAVTIAGSITALVANVAFGALSDLTRSRFGRRNPWVIGGGVAGAIFMALMATAQTIPLLILWWCLYQAAQNAIVMALAAWVPDRVPNARRGTISAVSSLGVLIGLAIGALVGARFIGALGSGFLLLAAAVALLSPICVLLAPDFSNKDQSQRDLNPAEFLACFAFPPRSASDFYWALIGRLLIVLGYHLISGYQLYILTDYMKLDGTAAARFVSLAAITSLGASLIGNVIAGPLSDRLARRKVIVIVASVLIGLGAVVPFFAPQPWTLLAFAGLGGLGLGVYFSVDTALMSEVLPSDGTRGKDLGILSMANTGGQIVAPAVSSLIIGMRLGFAPIFLVTLAFCVLGALAIVPIRKVR